MMMKSVFFTMAAAIVVGGLSRPAFCLSEPNDVPATLIRTLEAARSDREQLIREWREWEMEKEKLQLLLDTIEQETSHYRRQAAQVQREIDNLEQTLDELHAVHPLLEKRENVFNRLAGTFAEQLRLFKKNALPGIVPQIEQKAGMEPFEQFREMVRKVKAVRPELGRSRIEIVSGRLGDETVTVKLMRTGGVAGWWMALDYSRAGLARMVDGQLQLTVADNPAVVENIRKGLDILESRRVSDWVILPVEKP